MLYFNEAAFKYFYRLTWDGLLSTVPVQPLSDQEWLAVSGLVPVRSLCHVEISIRTSPSPFFLLLAFLACLGLDAVSEGPCHLPNLATPPPSVRISAVYTPRPATAIDQRGWIILMVMPFFLFFFGGGKIRGIRGTRGMTRIGCQCRIMRCSCPAETPLLNACRSVHK